MRINPNNKTMDMEMRDINYILPQYVRSYQFYTKNEIPTKIIFPMFASVNAAGVDIPIEWVPPLGEIAVEIAKDGSNVPEVTPEQEAALDEKDAEIARLKAELAQTGRGGEERGGEQQTEEAEGSQKEATTSEQLLDEAADLKLEEDTAIVPAPDESSATSPAKAAFAEENSEKEQLTTAFKVDPDPSHQPEASRIPKAAPGGDIGPGQGLSDMHSRDRSDQDRTAKDLVVEPDIEGAAEKEFGKEISRDEQGKPIVEG